MGPRVIILEGLNGVGKSAVARLLSASLGIPIIRPFRHSDSERHLGREPGRGLQQSLRSLGIPANTFVDDMYVADLVTALGASAVLDRSMASAIAYGLLYKDVRDVQHALALTEAWQEAWARYAGRLLYVYLTADSATMAARTEGRWAPNPVEECELDRGFKLAYRWTRLPKLKLDTTTMPDAEATAARILEAAHADVG